MTRCKHSPWWAAFLAALITASGLAHGPAPIVAAADPAEKKEPGAASWVATVATVESPQNIKLGRCSAVATNRQGQIYLLHRGPQPVICLDAQGKFLFSWESEFLTTPHGLRIDSQDHVWITDIGQHRVLKFDPRGKLLLNLGTGAAGQDGRHFDQPTDVAFHPDGSFYVTDGYGNSRVLKFSASGELLKQWGVAGSQPSQFKIPHAIVIDAHKRLIVGDRENNRLQIFNDEGKFLAEWPGFAPYGLALNSHGQLFVADGRAHQVLRLDNSGQVVERIGKQGTALLEFELPHMLAFDSRSRLWVAEVQNQRFQVLTPPTSR
ncbi:MAG: peptidyl-alpha-hydroxyglycine alpha-amidating lyase family protein [Planctomycetota bacterium]